MHELRENVKCRSVLDYIPTLVILFCKIIAYKICIESTRAGDLNCEFTV